MAYDAVRRQAEDGRLAAIGGEAAVSDPAANGEVCFRAYQKTGNAFFLDGANRMLEYLNRKAPRTADGIITHNNVSFEKGFSSSQLWIDGLYMVPPFLAVMGQTDTAAEQIRGYIRHLYDETSGLFFHIVDTESGRYVRKKHWATGNGWALLGLARVIEAAAEQGRTEICAELSRFLNRLLDAMLAFQCPDGRFHDFVIRQFLFCQQGETRVVVFDFVDGEIEVVGKVLRGGLRRARE
jgi:rhamnogalacturonyl hydrolase YesR